MVQTANVRVGGEDITIKYTDRIQEIFEELADNEAYDLMDRLEQTAAEYPDHDVFRLFDDAPPNRQLTEEFLSSAWGTRFYAEIDPGLKQRIVSQVTENPDLAQNILEELVEESITNTYELTEFLIAKAQEDPETVHQVFELTVQAI